MSVAARSLLAAAAVTLVTVGTGVVLADDPDEEGGPVTVPSRSLEELDTEALLVRRSGFCGAVDPDRVAEALAGEPVSEVAYGPGDLGPPGSGADVVHEHGCSWTGPDGRTAAAWVFAPPVTPDRATRFGEAAAAARGCTPVPGAAAYGAPSVALVCTGRDRTEASFRGLFGDAWLVCSLTAAPGTDPAGLTERTGRWCAAVATAASG